MAPLAMNRLSSADCHGLDPSGEALVEIEQRFRPNHQKRKEKLDFPSRVVVHQ